jgi:hypothetical protein
MRADDKSAPGWTVPPLKRRDGDWQPPKPPLRRAEVDQKRSVATASRLYSADDEFVVSTRSRLPNITYWHVVILLAVVAVVANRDKLPGLWAEVFYRKPTNEWSRATALKKMPEAFLNGTRLNFEIEAVHPLREGPGAAAVTLSGKAIARDPLYEPISVTDPLLGLENKLRDLRAAEDRARFLRERAGAQIREVDENAFHFVKEVTSAGQSARFDFQFEARRDQFEWHVEKIISAVVTPTTAFLGKPISDFGEGSASPAIIGSEKAKSDIAELTSEVDRFIADVFDTEKAAKKRFVAEGRDERGNFLFPPNESMAGERFAVTRMRVIQFQELQSWTDEDVQYAINELFARHGAEFADKKVAAWFHQFNWYRPKPNLRFDQIESSLPDIESQNVKTLGYARDVKQENARAAAARQAQAMAIAQAQQQQGEAQQRAQQEAAIRAQQEEAARQMIGNLLQGIANSIPQR